MYTQKRFGMKDTTKPKLISGRRSHVYTYTYFKQDAISNVLP